MSSLFSYMYASFCSIACIIVFGIPVAAVDPAVRSDDGALGTEGTKVARRERIGAEPGDDPIAAELEPPAAGHVAGRTEERAPRGHRQRPRAGVAGPGAGKRRADVDRPDESPRAVELDDRG